MEGNNAAGSCQVTVAPGGVGMVGQAVVDDDVQGEFGAVWVLPLVQGPLEVFDVGCPASEGVPEETESFLVGTLIEVFEAGRKVLLCQLGDGGDMTRGWIVQVGMC